MTQISAKIKKTEGNRINQCDIFHDIDIVECITEGADGVSVSYIRFPLMICLNQDCDLNSDERDKLKENSNKDCRLLHLIVAPLFNFDVFKDGQHWGDIFQTGQKYNPNRTDGKKIMMVIDFKHFYTVSTEYLYRNINNRVCSLSELYREKISQRFAYFISRIGLPE